jgi:hypothetical protein
MFGQTFYWQTIRKYVSLFGTLFDDIHIIRTNTSGQETAYIKVPITYAPKEKMLARVQQDPNIDRPTATLTMPFMSFEMTDVRYDGDRKLKTIQRTANKLTTNASSLQYQYMPVPYNFGFKLFIMVKNAEDGTKIVEQILPYFTPDFTVTLQLIPQMNELKDCPIILNSISQEDTYTGDFKERQSLIWTLDFTLKGYLYGPVKSIPVIKYAIVNYYTPEVPDGQLDTAVGVANAVSQTIDQPGLTPYLTSDITTLNDDNTIYTIDEYGPDSGGRPTSNASMSIPVSMITVTDDFGFVITKTDFQ